MSLNSSDAAEDDGGDYYDCLVNRLTKQEIDAIIAHYEETYDFVVNDQGCKIMDRKKKKPKKRLRDDHQPAKWEPLARKTDSYLQVTVNGIKSNSERFKELFPKGKVQKVEWHRLCWRKHNNYEKCVFGKHICHRCGNRDCGTEGHLIQASRDLNEEHKHCCYFHCNGNLFLFCIHDPPCIPKQEAKPLSLISDNKIKSAVQFL